MEVWTFIHKETKDIIRFDIYAYDLEFGNVYYFTSSEYSALWFVKTKEEAEIAYVKFVHPQYTMFHERPSTDKIDIDDYYIGKFELK